MSLGTLYGTTEIRALAASAIIKHYDLDIEIVSKNDPKFAENFPLGLRPGFIGSDGLKLTQSIPITLYLVSLAKNNELLGDSPAQYAQILEWMSFANCEVLPTAINVFGALLGWQPFVTEVVENLNAQLHNYMLVFESFLKDHEFLVGSKYTLADLYVLALLIRPFQYLFDRAWRETHPCTTQWFGKMLDEPILKNARGAFAFIDRRVSRKEKKVT